MVVPFRVAFADIMAEFASRSWRWDGRFKCLRTLCWLDCDDRALFLRKDFASIGVCEVEL